MLEVLVVVSEHVRLQIETFSKKMLTGSALLARAKQGRVGPVGVHAYLRSIHFLISGTEPNLHRARARAHALGQHELAEYFYSKLLEEKGHEAWAASDMRKLAERFGALGAVSPAPAIVALRRFNEQLIDSDPRLYVAHILCVEYFTVLVGPAWVEALTSSCGVPALALTVVSRHVEADVEHARVGFEALERFLSDPEVQPLLQNTLDTILGYLAQFPEDLLAMCPSLPNDSEPARALPIAV